MKTKNQAKQFKNLMKNVTKIEEGDNTTHELTFTFKDGSSTKEQFDGYDEFIPLEYT